MFPPACEERKALGEADIQLCAGSSGFQQQLGKVTPIHRGWLEGNHKTPGRSPCKIIQDRMGVIWVDGEKLKTKWDASDGLKQDFFRPEWIGRVLLFHSPMAIYNDSKTLVICPAESGLVFGIFDLHTHPWYQHWPLRSSPQLKNSQNFMNIAEKSDTHHPLYYVNIWSPQAHWGSPPKSICSWAGTTLQVTPHTGQGEVGDILAHI